MHSRLAHLNDTPNHTSDTSSPIPAIVRLRSSLILTMDARCGADHRDRRGTVKSVHMPEPSGGISVSSSRRRLIESAQLKEHERIEDDSHPAERSLRGTWTHSNPSMMLASNPRFLWRFLKGFGVVLVLVIVLWLILVYIVL